MTQLAITFAAWNAWVQTNESPTQWQKCSMSSPEEHVDNLPPIKTVPAMLKRRLGGFGKMAVTSAEAAISDIDKEIPTVFSSQHGDLTRTLKLLQSLAEQEPLSPTDFSLSVHNAIAGIYSIARNDRSPTTALCGFHDDVSSALLETQLILEEQNTQYALCIVHDERLPKIYQPYSNTSPGFTYAASFLLSLKPQPNSITLKLELSGNPKNETSEYPSALSLIHHLNSPTQQAIEFSTNEKLWTWSES